MKKDLKTYKIWNHTPVLKGEYDSAKYLCSIWNKAIKNDNLWR